ncbi:molybdenum cofactor guanylyltransferase, partial [Rhodococcus erythropolis]
MTTTPPTAAVILAGGRGTRMGGVDKPGLLVHGRRLLDIALSATSHLDAVVVVGPHRPELDPGITQTQESPAGAGPVEAIWAGLSATRLPDNAVVVVLASDLPHIEAESVDALIAATSTDNPVTCAVDENNRTQFLFSAWTFRELRQRLSTLRESSGLENQPMKAIVTEPFSTLSVAGTTDCDTPEDIDRARSHPRLT